MELKEKIRVIEGFPTEGISFKDITTLIKDKDDFKITVDTLVEQVKENNINDIDIIVGPEARGFIFGTAMAYALGTGFVPIRKPGKLPAETVKYSYALEYGEDTIEMHADAIRPGQKVLIVDDLLATGGTLEACAKLVEKLDGEVVGIVALIELTDLKGRDKLTNYKVISAVEYPY